MKVYERQEAFLSQLLLNLEEEWQAIVANEPFKNIENFLAFLHLHPTQIEKNNSSQESLPSSQHNVYLFLSHSHSHSPFHALPSPLFLVCFFFLICLFIFQRLYRLLNLFDLIWRQTSVPNEISVILIN
jgi:hypothetical protein